MIQQKQSLQQTLQIIADILSFEMSHKVLEQHLSSNDIDWDAIVSVASKHLVLPAVYCRLAQKSLLEYLPEDLVTYLNELTALNRARNRTLIAEAKEISNLFKEHNIDHVFIKGMALLAGNYFKDYGERMIADIDILVATEDIDKAFNLLVAAGYSQFIEFNYKVKNYRHRPRQISEQRIGAIELHDQLLKHGYNHLIDKDSFLAKKEIVEGMAIPSSENLIWNSVLAQQINDKSYYFGILNFKVIYDVLVLDLNLKEHMITALSTQKYCSRFLALSSLFVNPLRPHKIAIATKFQMWQYQITLKFPKIGSSSYRLKLYYTNIEERLELIFFNQSYRQHVIKNKLLK